MGDTSARSAWFGDHGIVGDIIEASPHNEVAVDADGVIAFANARALRTFGYAADELIGAPVEVLLPQELGERHRHHRAGFAVDPAARPMGIGLEVLGRRRDGSTLPVEVSLTPVNTPRGRWVLCAIADVSARRETEDTLERVHRAYRTIAALNQAVVLARGPEELFAEACRIAVDEGGYLGSWVVARGQGTTVRTIARAGTLTEAIDQIDFSLDPDNPLSAGPTATALLEDRAVFSADAIAEDAPWHRAAAAFGIRGTAALPLRREGQLVAVISLWSDGPRVFEGEHRELLEGLAENISFALDTFAASARLVRLAQQRTDLLRRVVAAQEEERARIAADVHDESVQSLAAVDLRLGALARRVQELAPELAPSVAQLQVTVAAVAAGLRHLLFDLDAPDTGPAFDDALREAAGHVFEHSQVRWSVTVERQDPSLDDSFQLAPNVHTQALRIAKEALINVRKHAGACEVAVAVREVSGGVEVEVTDDGTGVRSGSTASAPGHRGVSTMHDRAELVGGWCRLEDGEQGLTVRFWVPRETPPVLSLAHELDRA